MNLNDLHRRLLQDVLEIGNDLPLVITGGYAVQAHHIVDRFSRDIDMATDSMVAMEAIVATVVEGLTGRGWRVEVIGVDPHGARMMTTLGKMSSASKISSSVLTVPIGTTTRHSPSTG